jgi:hypothetical protein
MANSVTCIKPKVLKEYAHSYHFLVRLISELPQEGILFHTQFPSLGIFINKKVGFRKN